MQEEKIRRTVRERYGSIALQGGKFSCVQTARCCGEGDLLQQKSLSIGYSEEELREVPEGADLGLGCGNPVALASLREGEVVLDLGSGGGLDCFLAARRVGPKGRVIGVDMTPEMVEKARENARKGGYENVEFRLGEIENLPVADSFVDVVISNCVINLSPDKPRVFGEAFRVLRPGGRLMISDLVLLEELPQYIRSSVEAYIGCVAGALLKERYLSAITGAGFTDVKVVDEKPFPLDYLLSDPTIEGMMKQMDVPQDEAKRLSEIVVSIKVYAEKPKR